MAENLDSILTIIGTGKWNIIYYVLLGYWFSCVSYQTVGSVFLVPNVGYTCIPPESAMAAEEPILDSQVLDQSIANSTTTDSQNGRGSEGPSLCTYKLRNRTMGTEKEEQCTEWSYDNTTYISTATSEFHLVCEWEHIRASYQSIYMLGVFVGAGINGYIADSFGRRKLTLIGASLYTVIAILLTWLPSIPFIFGARFLLGTMHSASLVTGYVLLMEVTEPAKRIVIGMMIFITWSFGTMILAGMAYLVRDWRWLQLTISLPCLLFLPALWFIDESPRWLVINGRHEEALKILQKAARWNNAKLPPKEKILTIMNVLHKEQGCQPNEDLSFMMKVKQNLNGFIILLRTPKLRRITMSMYVDYFVVAMVYFGLSLGAGSFKVSPFLYMTITGLVEVPSHTITIPLVIRCGCKISLVMFYFITGACMLVQILIPVDYNWLAITITMIGKMSISTVYQILGLYSTELFPTEVRNRGLGSSMMMSRIGAMVSPFLMDFLGVTYPWAPPVVFGLASIIAGLASLPLHETKNTVLPDTVAHLEGYINPAMVADSDL